MTEAFSKIQQTIRRIKNEHAIDLAHPRGVLIGERFYPALQKHVTVHSPGTFIDYSGFFTIPTESGMHIRGTMHGQYGALQLGVLAPHIFTDEFEKKYYSHIQMSSPTKVQWLHYPSELEDAVTRTPTITLPDEVVPEFHATFNGQLAPFDHLTGNPKYSNPHKAIEGFSKLPLVGVALHRLKRKYTKLDEAELAEHRKNFKVERYHFPDTITIQYARPVMSLTPTMADAYKTYHYDVKTERLKESDPTDD